MKEISIQISFGLGGLIFLYAGGEGLVRGASRFAKSLGIKPIIIGLTVVAFGTSMPEAVVSIIASLQSKPDIAVSNIVGSNIFNIGFILGLSALIRPLRVDEGSIKREIPFVIGSALLLWLLGWDGFLSRLDGIVLLVVMAFFLYVCFKKDQGNDAASLGRENGNPFTNIFLIIGSLLLLIFGGKLFISGAVGIARYFEVSELIIGLTLVAAGTSLPELITSAIASYRGHDDLSIGNITGSNIFNILFVLGFCAVIFPLNVSSQFVTRDIPAMLALSVLCLPLMKTGFQINRSEGALLLLSYLGYLVFILKS